jgi:hypothetical protein
MPSVTTENPKLQTPVKKKKTVKRKVGTSIRALDKVVSPDFSDISFAGWTGKVVEVSGKKTPFKYFVEWDDAVVESMPESYVKRCEDQQIYHKWACLTDADLEAIE